MTRAECRAHLLTQLLPDEVLVKEEVLAGRLYLTGRDPKGLLFCVSADFSPDPAEVLEISPCQLGQGKYDRPI